MQSPEFPHASSVLPKSPLTAAGRPRSNPFASDVCRSPLEVAEEASVPGLHANLLDQLTAAVESPAGAPLVLLTAPRAGYGKTHLLGRVAAAAGEQAVMVPLAFRNGDTLSFATICRRGIETLHQTESEDEAWTRLRKVSAGVVLAQMHRLIESGQLSCANPEQALRILGGEPEEVFEEAGAAHSIGVWLMRHKDQLCPLLARSAAKQIPVRHELLAAWISAMFEQAAEGGLAGLASMYELTAQDAETVVPVWLRLVALWRPAVLLVDHLDGFYRNPQAGITIASILMDLVDGHGVHVLLSLNQDVWQATFGHHLPSALEDRLTSSQVLLRGINVEEAESLVRLRLEKAGVTPEETTEFQQFLDVRRFFLGRPIGALSARVFLRHVSQQWEIFQNSVPPPIEPEPESETDATEPLVLPEPDPQPVSPPPPPPVFEGGAPAPEPPSASAAVPLASDESPSEDPQGVPEIFDRDVGQWVKEMAAGLAEPRAALPQDEPSQPASKAMAAAIASANANEGSGASVSASGASVAPSPDAFEKLKEMLGRLRQPSSSNGVDAPEVEVEEKPALAAQPSIKHEPAPTDALLGRFEALRMQMAAEAEVQPLDYHRLAELIRLAGRRFPVVRFAEHELPGMTGRTAMGWSLQGVEILFGLASFADHSYWQTLAGFAAGRLTDLESSPEWKSGAGSKFKVVLFKTNREEEAYKRLLEEEKTCAAIKEHLDTVHLDPASVASLYAMQRIIREAESGFLQVEPAQVMSALARELDFFWKRITRAG